MRPIAILAVCGLLAGCEAPGAASLAASGLPIDSTIPAVSLSHPTPEATAALLACGIASLDPSKPDVRANLGTDIVSGMGLVAHARDVTRYAPVGPQPDLDSDAPAWVITTTGWITLPFDTVESLDPTCYIVGSTWTAATWVSTGGTRLAGVVMTALPEPPAVLRLPPLVP